MVAFGSGIAVLGKDEEGQAGFLFLAVRIIIDALGTWRTSLVLRPRTLPPVCSSLSPPCITSFSTMNIRDSFLLGKRVRRLLVVCSPLEWRN